MLLAHQLAILVCKYRLLITSYLILYHKCSIVKSIVGRLVIMAFMSLNSSVTNFFMVHFKPVIEIG